MPAIVVHLRGVERRQWLIERGGTRETWNAIVRHLGRVERQRLIERCGFIKHGTAYPSPCAVSNDASG